MADNTELSLYEWTQILLRVCPAMWVVPSVLDTLCQVYPHRNRIAY